VGIFPWIRKNSGGHRNEEERKKNLIRKIAPIFNAQYKAKNEQNTDEGVERWFVGIVMNPIHISSKKKHSDIFYDIFKKILNSQDYRQLLVGDKKLLINTGIGIGR